MACTFIASKTVNGKALKLFNVGNYQYEVCQVLNGRIKVVRTLYGYDYEKAVLAFNGMK